jgi:tetratricopeptide (TPR) repeat protein
VAAEYHASIRAAADQWKSLDDVQPQLDEFAHRLLARQYDEAAALIDAVDADCLRIWGHYRTVITLREQLLEKLTDPDLLQSNLGNLAMVYRRTGRLRDAVSYFERAIAHAGHADNKTALAKWHCERGNTFADLVEMDQAVEQYQQAIGIARRNNDLSGEARPLGNLAIAHRQLGNIREALNCYQQAIRIDEQRAAQAATHAERHEALRQRAMHVANSGKSYLALGQFQEARKCFQEGAEFMHADNYKYAEAVFVSHLGEADVARGAFADALGHFQKGIEILEQTGERRNLSYMLEGLGGAHHYLGNLADARACYEKCRECDVPETNYRGDVMLGLLDLEEGRRQPARDHLADSIALCRQLRSKTPHFYEAIYRQALALLARGDERDALATYEEALQACRAEGVVSAGLQELELLCRAAPDTPALDDTQRMLQAAMTQPSD